MPFGILIKKKEISKRKEKDGTVTLTVKVPKNKPIKQWMDERRTFVGYEIPSEVTITGSRGCGMDTMQPYLQMHSREHIEKMQIIQLEKLSETTALLREELKDVSYREYLYPHGFVAGLKLLSAIYVSEFEHVLHFPTKGQIDKTHLMREILNNLRGIKSLQDMAKSPSEIIPDTKEDTD